MKKILMTAAAATIVLAGCNPTPKAEPTDWAEAAVENAQKQMAVQIAAIEADTTKVLNPVTTARNRMSVQYCGYADWRSGFFPGSVWYLYELTGDSTLVPLAEKYTEAIDDAKKLTWHHDIGFIINCSFGNGRRLADKPEYNDVLVEAAKSLTTRFREPAGIIQSWDVNDGSWQSKRGW